MLVFISCQLFLFPHDLKLKDLQNNYRIQIKTRALKINFYVSFRLDRNELFIKF